MTKYQKYKLVTIVLFSSILLIILHNYSKNGRYLGADDNRSVIDTKTGTVYNYSNSKYYEIKDLEKYETNQE